MSTAPPTAPDEHRWHTVPRLDADDKVGPLPMSVARWLGAGVFAGPLVAFLFEARRIDPPGQTWGDWRVWALWALSLAIGTVGALWRPGGLHLGQWASGWIDYTLMPRRATRIPLGPDWRTEPWPPVSHTYLRRVRPVGLPAGWLVAWLADPTPPVPPGKKRRRPPPLWCPPTPLRKKG